MDHGSAFTLRLRLDAAPDATVVSPDSPLSAAGTLTNGHSLPPATARTLVDPEDETDDAAAAQRLPGRPATPTRRLLVLDRGGLALHAIRGMVGRDHGVELTSTQETEEALAVLDASLPDCLVIGSRLSKTSVFALLDALRTRDQIVYVPVILRLDRRVTERDRARLRRYEPALLPRVAESDEALAAEAALILHPASGPPVAGPEGDGDMQENTASPRLQGRILLVDDDVRNLFALASLLEDRGLDVVFSETGREALEILSADRRIDLVLMDLMMPQMDGYETIRAARAMPALRTLPIIAVTAKAMQGDREKSISAGASDYITKPVDPDKLISLVNGWLCV